MRYSLVNIVVLCFACFITFFQVKADVTALQRLSTIDGLSNNSVNVIFQDSRGYIWIGTEDGLNRYDGYEFKIYRFNPAVSGGISGNSILAIAEDKEAKLWIGTRKNGISILDVKTEVFTYLSHNPSDPESLPEEDVFGFYFSEEDDIWVKTENHLCRFDPNKKTFQSFGHFSNVFKRILSFGYPIVKESDQSLLIGTKDGINRFDLTKNAFERLLFHSTSGMGLQDAVFCLEEYGRGNYLAATSSGLGIFDSERSYMMRVPPEYDLGGRVSVNALCIDNKGEVWIGTNRGLDKFKPESHVHNSVFYNLVDDLPVISHSITSIIEDSSGLLWVGTRFHGVYKLSTRAAKFGFINKENFKSWPLQSYNIQSIYVDPLENIWLGTLSSGLYMINYEKGLLNHFVINPEAFRNRNDAVTAIHEDTEGTIWLGSNNGIYYKTRGSYSFREFHYGFDARSATLLRNNVITSIKSNESGVWFGTQFGLYRYSDDHIYSYFMPEDNHDDGLLGDEILTLCVDKEGVLWIGTSGGLNFYDQLMGQIRVVPLSNDELKYISQVLSIGNDDKGNLWLGTQSGLLKMYHGIRDSMRVEIVPELSGEMIAAVDSDSKGNVWFSSSTGISVLSNDSIVKDFDINDGLSAPYFNQGSAYYSNQGKMYFGSVDGLYWIQPDSIVYNSYAPKILITKVSTCHNGVYEDILFDDDESIKIRYRPGLLLEVEFAAMDFTQPHKNSFRVILEGYDEEWGPVTRSNSVSFANLTPGKYLLRIMGSNSDFVWNDTAIEVPFIIKPPIWMTNYAYAFYVLIFIFVIQMIINYRLSYYKKANRSLIQKNVDKHNIEKQKETLSKINQNLTDSINYATRIQSAMIPSEKVFRKIFPSSFVYFRPKDLVSGDFYWTHQDEDLIFVATVDCTGHGVPGAFMSIIGIDLLKNIITGRGIKNTAEILKVLSIELDLTLRQNDQSFFGSETIKDGMDVSLCVINQKERYVDFSGAVNGLYLIRNNELFAYKGDRYAIGRFMDGKIPEYTAKRIALQNEDILYMFTDGYVDQFGGVDHKKFKYRRFRHLLLNIHQFHPDDQKAVLHQKLEEWRNGEDQVDDILIVGYKPLKMF